MEQELKLSQTVGDARKRLESKRAAEVQFGRPLDSFRMLVPGSIALVKDLRFDGK